MKLAPALRPFALAALLLCACELLLKPDEVPPPQDRPDVGWTRPDASTCAPRSCGTNACGVLEDGCGGEVVCGKCGPGKECVNNACLTTCAPETEAELCALAAANCGSLTRPDRCGASRTVACGGACPTGLVCGGGSNPNACACTSSSCPDGTRCDAAGQSCVAGCARADQCPSGGDCVNGQCVCVGGTHLCAAACVANDARACGTSCQKCPTDAHGTAGCNGTSCTLSCDAGWLRCGTACAACPARATATACLGLGCVATACESGYSVCDDGCCAWHVETVTLAPADGLLAVAHDAAGVVHVAFYASVSGEMRWGRRNANGSWTIETLEPVAMLLEKQVVSLAVSPLDHEPAVLYVDGKNNLRLAERRKGGTSGWTKSTVETGALVAPSLAIDAAGTLHAAYGIEDWPFDVVYASRTAAGATWTREIVDSPYCTHLVTSLALDGSGKPALAGMETAVEDNNDDSVYLYRKGTGWTSERVDTGMLGRSVRLAFDPAGSPRVGYWASGDKLMIATKATPWRLAEHEISNAADDASFGVDADGDSHFAFVRKQTGSAYHGSLAGAAWSSDFVAFNAAGLALDLDPAGRPRFVFRDKLTRAVKYAWYGPDP